MGRGLDLDQRAEELSCLETKRFSCIGSVSLKVGVEVRQGRWAEEVVCAKSQTRVWRS